MATTRLGWDVFTSSSNSRLTNFPWITGKVRAGDAYTVLNELARRFNSEVEPIRRGWSWGWAYRPVRGASVISEHAAGTAVDFNAPRHPLGKTGTFTAAQVRAIRRILHDLDGAVRWGGDYRGRKDEMHFELQGGVKKLAAVAKKIKGGKTSSSGSTSSASSSAKYHRRATNKPNVAIYANRGSNRRQIGTASSKGYRLNVVKTAGSWTQVRWNYGTSAKPDYRNAWVRTVDLEGGTSTASSKKQWPHQALPVTSQHTTASDAAWRKLLADVGYKNRDLTVNFQNWLKDLGYYKRNVDGRFRAYTVEALQRFLKDRGFYRGIIDAHTAPYRVARGPMMIRAEIAYLNDQRKYY